MKPKSGTYAERLAYEQRLTDAGFRLTGGGGLVSRDSYDWDIFIEDPADPTREVMLHGASGVEQWLKENAR